MIEFRDVYKNFGKLEVLKGINLKIEKGEVVTLIGPSGSGKSTILRCMNLLAGDFYFIDCFKVYMFS